MWLTRQVIRRSIGIRATWELEIEGRLRWLENKMLSKDGLLNNNSYVYEKLKNYVKSLFYFIKYSIKRKQYAFK